MVTRYPHTATVYGASEKIVDGENKATNPLIAEITGRIEYLSQPKEVFANGGNKVECKMRFRTGPTFYTDAVELEFQGVRYRIAQWLPYQAHSIIYLVS